MMKKYCKAEIIVRILDDDVVSTSTANSNAWDNVEKDIDWGNVI